MINKNSVRLSRKSSGMENLYGVCSAKPSWMPHEQVVTPFQWHINGQAILTEIGVVKILDPISKFLSQNYEKLPYPDVVLNFKYFCKYVLDKNIFDFIEEEDIYIEPNGAISIEIYKDTTKTFISIGKETCGYYIKSDGKIVLQEDTLVFGSKELEPKLILFKRELLKFYQHPIVNKLYNRIMGLPIMSINEV